MFRTTNIRLDFLARRLLESVFLFWLIIAFVQQWIMPHLQETEERKHKSQVNLRTNQNHAVLQFKEPVQVTILGRILKSGFIFVESLPYHLLTRDFSRT